MEDKATETEVTDTKITDTLRSIGLNKNEVIVYLDLLANNNSLSKDIIKRTKIHKANIYETLKNLILKGFVKENLKEDKPFFIALDPEIFVEYLENKQKEIKEIIPDIPTSTASEIDSGPEISVARGILAARNALMDLIECNSEIIIYSIPKKIMDELGIWFVNEFDEKRVKKKIPIKQLFDENIPERIEYLNKLPYTEARYAGVTTNSTTFFCICDDFILTIIPTNHITTIKVKNKNISDAYRNNFKILWKNSKIS